MFAAACLLAASCSKNASDYSTAQNGVTDEQVQDNVEKVFGTTFDPSHDWCTTQAGEVTINTNPGEVKKVQVLVYTADGQDEDGGTITSLKVLNEALVGGQSTLKLYYDAPSENLGLYVAFITESNYVLRKVEGSTVSYHGAAKTRATVAATGTNYDLPTVEPEIGVIEDSWASQRGWIPGEKLYGLSDYSTQKMTVENYDSEEIDAFRALVFSYFKNGRSYNNLPLVKQSGLYNANVYPITTGDEPIIVSPVYKCDGGSKYGNEVLNSDLYYYYFKEEDLGSDTVAYLESLPKYKAIPFVECLGAEDVIQKQYAYALIYWGDGVPAVGTKGTYNFPSGYKIGFMVRAKTTSEAPKKQGELYGDGRLNSHINAWPNFSSSKLGSDGPRQAWLTVNNRMLLCFESGTDTDFNDVIMEVEGGIDNMVVIPETDVNAYTYCFEDTQLGDYDMNDIVIKAVRQGNQVTYSIVACGAYDQLYVRNINSGDIHDDVEVHEMFGTEQNVFINTVESQEKLQPKSATITVSNDFSFLDVTKQPYIYNRTKNREIRLAKIGEDPHGIMIPNDFLYPKERVCIKDAYTEFNNWGRSHVTSTDWYKHPTASATYNK